MIQIIQSWTVLILEPMNPEESDVILDTTTSVHATTTLNATALPPPLSWPEDVPPPSPQAPPPLETNEVLMDLVNMLHQQSDRLERVEKNQEKISTVIAMHIEEYQQNKHRTTPLAANYDISTPVDH
jgi:hypothetical protein